MKILLRIINIPIHCNVYHYQLLQHFVGPDLGPNCLFRFSVDNKSPLADELTNQKPIRLARFIYKLTSVKFSGTLTGKT